LTLEKSLQEIREAGSELGQSLLFELSNLTAAETATFAATWADVPSERRLTVVGKLLEMAHENTDLDFSSVLRQCLKDRDSSVRQSAIEGLWECEDRVIILPLCQIIREDQSPEVRASAALALGKFADLAQGAKLLRKDEARIQQCLLGALQDVEEELEVRRRALEAAASFNTEDIKAYIQWAYESEDTDLRGSSLYAMGKTGEPFWLEILVKELNSSVPPLRYEAANACAALEDEEAIPHLVPLMDDDDLEVQLSAVRAIGTIGGPLAKKALRRCLKTGDPTLEDAAREYLDQVMAMEDPLTFDGAR